MTRVLTGQAGAGWEQPADGSEQVGEACGLDLSDVDTGTGVVTIRAGKLAKAREVPLHPTASQALRAYGRRRDQLCPAARTPAFFVNIRGSRLASRGIAHPVAGGGALPGDDDVDVDAEHAGEDGGGEFGGELEQSGGTGWSGADPDLAEALVEPTGADRLAGASAGQQPRGGAVVSGGGVALAGGDQVKDETSERFGEYDGFPAEPQRYFAAAVATWESAAPDVTIKVEIDGPSLA